MDNFILSNTPLLITIFKNNYNYTFLIKEFLLNEYGYSYL